MDSEEQGPPIYRNWLAAIKNSASLGAYEVPLFTDAHITGTVLDGYGPYQFLNTVPYPRNENEANPALILRVTNYLNHELPSMTETKENYYHGGWLADEVSALLSLCLGIRVKPGSISREFDIEGDPKGFPISLKWRKDPIFIKSEEQTALPRVGGSHSLDDIKPLSTFPNLTAADATTLIRSARLYQDGLWIAESDPNLCWLMLVSAVETAAVYWKSDSETTSERVKMWKPDLVELIIKHSNEELAVLIADKIADLTGATSKFINFFLNFFPDEPNNRPPDWAQLEWTPKSFKKSLSIIYGYRSRALHDGKPFPSPMFRRPHTFDGNIWAEVPIGLASGTSEHVWLRKDTPMLLHTFEYLVRQSLLKWWFSMSGKKNLINNSDRQT